VAPLALNGGTITDATGNTATLTHLSPGSAGSLSANKNLVIDTTPPTVTNVTAAPGSGTFGVGRVIAIRVQFSKTVVVTGTPMLTLVTGATDEVVGYASSQSSASTLVFTYTVAAGDTSADLGYLSPSALALSGGTIKGVGGNPANLTLPDLNTAGSLSFN